MHSDKDLVWEAISNLVQNAIRMSTEGQQVVLKTEPDEAGLTIAVSDEIALVDNEPGQAGFGLEIVKQIASMLDAEFALQPNLAVLRFGSPAA